MSQFMKSNQLISIIMTCFNGEQYLRESISSIMSQTYKEWEIIFIDNNSNDKSREIILSYDDDRIKYFQLNETLNLGSVRSFALSKCFGHFITFLDVDDIWCKFKLERQIRKFLNDNRIDVLYTNYYKFSKYDKKKIEKKLFRGKCQKEIIISYINGLPLTAWLTLMIKKSAISNLEYDFDKKLHIASDFDLIIRLSKFCFFDYLDDFLCSYRIHDLNESKNKKKEIYELFYIINKYKKDSSINKILSTNLFSKKIYLKYLFFKFSLF